MKITVLTDNNSSEDLEGEWGLSFWIETESGKILLDTGATSLFHENARKLGIRIEEADCAVLSHAHYDHCGGLEKFFEVSSAPAYLRAGSKENCYHRKEGVIGYIGIPHGLLERYADRIIPVHTVTEILPKVWIVPHTPLRQVRNTANPSLLVLEEGEYKPDCFDHEQSLVAESAGGLVIFSSCSHTGPSNITADVRKAFPGRPIRAFIGGLHIYRWTREQVKDLAEEIKEAGIEKIYTGHCTGEAFTYLKDYLEDKAEQFYAGMIINLKDH